MAKIPHDMLVDTAAEYINMESILGTKKLYLNEKYSDVRFVFALADGVVIQIPAHRVILAASSEVFDLMFYGENDFDKSKEIKIVGTGVEAFEEFLQFFYLRTVKLKMENIAAVMGLTNQYMMPSCTKTCAEFLKEHLSLRIVCLAFELANLYGQNDLKEFCMENIQRNLMVVLATDTFKQCSQDTLKEILQSSQLKECGFMNVYKICFDWATIKCEENNVDASKDNVMAQLGNDICEMIHFKAMNFLDSKKCEPPKRCEPNDNMLN